ncbi:hypothetical protein C8Q79DRAFT_597807 [Trametes meyenii]|nr:hypothetical protein C8Q79DRAFT_597807 [Trametes meyenii]
MEPEAKERKGANEKVDETRGGGGGAGLYWEGGSRASEIEACHGDRSATHITPSSRRPKRIAQGFCPRSPPCSQSQLSAGGALSESGPSQSASGARRPTRSDSSSLRDCCHHDFLTTRLLLLRYSCTPPASLQRSSLFIFSPRLPFSTPITRNAPHSANAASISLACARPPHSPRSVLQVHLYHDRDRTSTGPAACASIAGPSLCLPFRSVLPSSLFPSVPTK